MRTKNTCSRWHFYWLLGPASAQGMNIYTTSDLHGICSTILLTSRKSTTIFAFLKSWVKGAGGCDALFKIVRLNVSKTHNVDGLHFVCCVSNTYLNVISWKHCRRHVEVLYELFLVVDNFARVWWESGRRRRRTRRRGGRWGGKHPHLIKCVDEIIPATQKWKI